jgi:hypothetical protein
VLRFALASTNARCEFHRGTVYPMVSDWQAPWLGAIVTPCR